MSTLGFTWYPKDWWTSDTFFSLPPELKYIYIEILSMMYLNDGKWRPDRTILLKRFGVDVGESGFEILKERFVIDGDFWTHESVNKRLKKANAARSNGKKGGAPKGNSNAQKQPKQPKITTQNNPPLESESKGNIKESETESETVSQPPPNPLQENENKVVEHVKAVNNIEQKIDTAKNGILELLKTEQYEEIVSRKIRGKNLSLENEVEKWLRYNSETVNFLNESPLKISSSLIPWLIRSKPQKAESTSTPSNLSEEQLKILENCKAFLAAKAPLIEIDEPYLISKIKKGLTGISLYHLVNQANVQGFKKEDWGIKNLLGLFFAQVNPANVSQKGSKFIKW